jgi:hypothetical protein
MTDHQRTTTDRPAAAPKPLAQDFENVYAERDDQLRNDIAAFRARVPRVSPYTTPHPEGERTP